VLAAGLLALVAVGLAHGLLGVDALAHSGIFPPCPFRAATGVPCPGCGMTRAFLLLAQLRLGEALAAHPLAPALALALGWKLLGRGWPARIPRDAAVGVALALVTAVWIVRLA
jgi:hypothetical protein